jgi:hypothetical protein
MKTFDKPFEVRPNTGTLFSVTAKNLPTSPDYFGEIAIAASTIKVVDGVATIKISGWKKKAKNGKTYLSIAVNDPSMMPSKKVTVEVEDEPF